MKFTIIASLATLMVSVNARCQDISKELTIWTKPCDIVNKCNRGGYPARCAENCVFWNKQYPHCGYESINEKYGK